MIQTTPISSKISALFCIRYLKICFQWEVGPVPVKKLRMTKFYSGTNSPIPLFPS